MSVISLFVCLADWCDGKLIITRRNFPSLQSFNILFDAVRNIGISAKTIIKSKQGTKRQIETTSVHINFFLTFSFSGKRGPLLCFNSEERNLVH